jgi:hypothetical protein
MSIVIYKSVQHNIPEDLSCFVSVSLKWDPYHCIFMSWNNQTHLMVLYTLLQLSNNTFLVVWVMWCPVIWRLWVMNWELFANNFGLLYSNIYWEGLQEVAEDLGQGSSSLWCHLNIGPPKDKEMLSTWPWHLFCLVYIMHLFPLTRRFCSHPLHKQKSYIVTGGDSCGNCCC